MSKVLAPAQQGRRKRWNELTPQQQQDYRWVFMPEDGERMEDIWEMWMDAIQEDGSYQTDGWPCN